MPKRRLQHIIVELQQELDGKYRQLEAELTSNREARIHHALVASLCAINYVLSDLLGVGGAPRSRIGACESDAELDARIGELISLLSQAAAARSAASGGGGGGGGGAEPHTSDNGSAGAAASGPSATEASGGTCSTPAPDNTPEASGEPPVGTLGVPTSTFLASVRAAYDNLDMGKDEFVAYWRDTIHKAAVLAHQQDWDAGAREELNGVRAATDASGGTCSTPAPDNTPEASGEPPVGTLGVPTSTFLASVRAAYDNLDMGKDEFVAYWRDTIHKAAVLAHQQDWDAGAREELNGLLHDLSSRSVGLCLRKLWFFSLFNYNLETRAPEEAPKPIWARIAASMQLTPEQDFVFEVITRWWKTQEESLQSRRRALAEASTAAPDDVELQDEVAAELGKVLTLYKVSLMPFMVLLSCALLRPAQLAAFYVQSWPWMPVLTPILEALEERRANDRGVTGTAGAAATAGATAGAAPS
ncbi:hypothetical protein Rsub_10204 [Raphidocelis subcapitata]|uniref:Uncharacterized protein n=1 Tax=Raphidocelis subcapitata TaxID=307507 RepID=A0A2V0PE38_9CHLO|nr:hypothetical protein Rsub_10204 [Raphidocelis subcapitata]|eukprot:GBF97779.1 hypothetical protein Rsub_10204 [Raphidocelis subcapitata]